MSEQNNVPQVSDKKSVDNKRRDALKKMGRYAAYTAPALLVMLSPKEGRAGLISGGG